MAETKTVFFRNDDVGFRSGHGVEPGLMAVTAVFIEEGIPICHAVVPRTVNKETVRWLLDMKSRHTGLLSIGQHGYSHARHGKGCGEFAPGRSYERQRSDIEAGMEMMREYFGLEFSLWFAPPWIRYDRCTKVICDTLGFRVFSGGVSPRLRARAFNALGRGLGLNRLGPKEVSYHRRRSFNQLGFSIKEISVSVDVVEDYRARRLKPLDSILYRFGQCRRHFDVIGIMLHHWVFDSVDKLQTVRALLRELKKNAGNRFLLLDDVDKLSASKDEAAGNEGESIGSGAPMSARPREFIVR